MSILANTNKTLLCVITIRDRTGRKKYDVVGLTVIRALIFIPGTHIIVLQKHEENSHLLTPAEDKKPCNSHRV